MAGQDYMSAVEHIQNLYTTLKKDVSAEELASVQEMWDGRYKWKSRSFFFSGICFRQHMVGAFQPVPFPIGSNS